MLPREPLVARGGLVVTGGRNLVLVGGEIRIPDGVPRSAGWEARRGLYLKDQRGVVHVEGLRLSGDLAEGIDVAQTKGAVVQLQNIRVDAVRGSYDSNHADLLQVWAGPAELRVDGFSGSTGYQGFFLLPNQHYDGPAPRRFDIRRVRITGLPGSAYLLWAPKDADWLHLSDVQVLPDDERSRRLLLRPVAAWDDVRVATGAALSPAALPAGAPGAGYRSPGYLRG